MIIAVQKIDGKWLVNGKCYTELNTIEKAVLKEFFLDAKIKAIEAGEYESEIPIFEIKEPNPIPNDKDKKPIRKKN